MYKLGHFCSSFSHFCNSTVFLLLPWLYLIFKGWAKIQYDVGITDKANCVILVFKIPVVLLSRHVFKAKSLPN